MKRDPRLRALSSDHHRALVMARRIERASETEVIDPAVLSEIEAFYQDELLPHFKWEEEILLPPLEGRGEHELVMQTLREHRQMVDLAPRLNEREVLAQFAQLLKQHVRFEEQQLLEVAQTRLSGAELGAVAGTSR